MLKFESLKLFGFVWLAHRRAVLARAKSLSILIFLKDALQYKERAVGK